MTSSINQRVLGGDQDWKKEQVKDLEFWEEKRKKPLSWPHLSKPFKEGSRSWKAWPWTPALCQEQHFRLSARPIRQPPHLCMCFALFTLRIKRFNRIAKSRRHSHQDARSLLAAASGGGKKNAAERIAISKLSRLDLAPYPLLYLWRLLTVPGLWFFPTH